jgi:hypothetical protein
MVNQASLMISHNKTGKLSIFIRNGRPVVAVLDCSVRYDPSALQGICLYCSSFYMQMKTAGTKVEPRMCERPQAISRGKQLSLIRQL